MPRVFTKEHRQKLRESRLGRKLSEETKNKMRLAHIGNRMSDESRQKMREKALARISPCHAMPHTEETKEKLRQYRLEKHSCWKGGKSFEKYPVEWNETLRRSIRERDHYVCRICGLPQGDKTHHVHHIDYDKHNCSPNNLITLCISCHVKTNRNRDKWKQLLLNLLKGFN